MRINELCMVKCLVYKKGLINNHCGCGDDDDEKDTPADHDKGEGESERKWQCACGRQLLKWLPKILTIYYSLVVPSP